MIGNANLFPIWKILFQRIILAGNFFKMSVSVSSFGKGQFRPKISVSVSAKGPKFRFRYFRQRAVSVVHYHQGGLSFLQAAIKGAKEICVPVTFSILTNIVAFMPLYFVPGVMGKFFRVIPLIVCTTFVISLVEALFILPAHLAHQKENKTPNKLHLWQQGFSKKFKSSSTNCLYGMVKRWGHSSCAFD